MGTDAVPPWLERRAALLGADGHAWLTAIPDVVVALQRRWAVTVEEELSGGTSAWVARVRRSDGTPAVLKIAMSDEACEREVALLQAAGGRGYARLLAAEPEHRAVLLEALGPALERSGLAPERQIEILCAALRDAWQVPAPDAAPEAKAEALADLVGRLWDELDRPCSARVVELALEYARRRADASGRLVVVHGDPHPGNALRRPDGTYVFVDPDGFVADPAYDLGVVLRDWCPELLAGDASELAGRYCRLLAARTGIDGTAIDEWGFLERVSSGLHILELGMSDLARPFLETAEQLAAARR
ncbi:aminoglycoside phosphotransferase family protein [Pseudonocardia charpentierae]|uniref:Aminoglycoside phosphotransferase family protein n=1 Tax=Pseudonocardia charpentierae TaxID=3075545 RepID=A0ABU2NF05_9PSEU|nr:aminoglycoside phosphotransferase family protein [Pseudonocardia sp. DSM 45834]MDT0352536.1 aminoglycoside phosphotransferase family protein [Pseudonocardia sp. DSM 45834]